jgi:transposase
MNHSDRAMSDALKDYVNTERPTKDIAAQYGVSASTLTVWAKKQGIALRGRGRERQRQPDARTREILEMAETLVLEDVGKAAGISKQRVSKILRRWKGWKKPKETPFEPGERIMWKDQEFEVIMGGPLFGKVKNMGGEIIHNFYWTMDGNQAVRKSDYKPNGHIRKNKPKASRSSKKPKLSKPRKK